jgi:hypothetical protein
MMEVFRMVDVSCFAGVDVCDPAFVALVDEAVAMLGVLIDDVTALPGEREDALALLTDWLVWSHEVEADVSLPVECRRAARDARKKFLNS